MEISKNYLTKSKRDPHLHSPDHVLADELSSKLGDPRHFGFYLKTARVMDHNVLRQIMGGILEGKSSNPGALFAYLVKKHNSEKNTTVGHSLWLLPNMEADRAFSDLISSLAQTFNSPIFKPHVTLISGLDEARHVDISELSELPAISIETGPVKIGESFFKSIYIPIIKNKFLLAIRRKGKKLFQTEARGTYDPHLSLLYSNTPEADKQAAIKQFITHIPSSIFFDRVALVQTHGQAHEWKIKKIINLKQTHDTQNS